MFFDRTGNVFHTNARTASHERSRQPTRTLESPHMNAHAASHERSCYPTLTAGILIDPDSGGQVIIDTEVIFPLFNLTVS